MLEFVDVTKRYRSGVLANDGISLRVEEGEVFGLLGHNGAGKTTLVSQVVGLLRPDHGQITVAGIDAIAQPAKVREVCSLQAQTNAPLTGITPRKAIELIGRIRGGDRRRVQARCDELLARLRLEPWADRKAQSLSGGVNRLVAFCMAVVEPGRLVVLDEPTNDVDPVRRRLLWDEVRRLADHGCTVVLVTHNVAEAERAVDRIAILDEGRTVAVGSPSALKRDVADELRLDIVWEPDHLAVEPLFEVSAAVTSGRRSRFTLHASLLEDAASWAQALRAAGHAEEFSIGPATLEDVYIDLVGRLDDDHPSVEEAPHAGAR
ncbi:MAG TPA: ABC transporter ATP-binding protein [Acidimicrobiales bacterium]|nr:ABC transporter ATP-binding protein [Acidimicrobiales bacterium]